ncbi:MAG: putative phosphate transport regulator [Bacteroidetes bacterium]|nr:putative phosphate transport regulator [Bacteroidota bacterium]
MKNSFFSKFTPKETKFFPILKEITGVMLVATDLIIECVQKGDHESAIDYYKKIKEQEKKGDALANHIFEELNTTFITPFDREDINHLANLLDDVIDRINSCAKKVLLYNPRQMPSSAVDLANELRNGVIYIGKAVDELDVLKKSSKKVKDYCKELHDIENRADDVYEHFLIDLFENEKDGIELIKLKEIMTELEKATDVTELVGKTIKTIIVKYA